jgi:transcriptional regulator GlxA family with amidase domain
MSARKITRSRRVVLLAFEQMNLLDLSGPLQALASANRLHAGKGGALYETCVASAHGGLVTTSSGLPIMTVSIASLKGVAIDTLIVPGGSKGDTFYSPPELVKWVAQRAPRVRRLCSVCTGAFLLAATGLLDGLQVATHWDWIERLKAQNPAVLVDADRIFIRDGSIWTSAGVTAGIDLTLALIEEDFGHAVAIATARQLVVFMKRPGGQSQFSVPLRAQAEWMGDFADLHAWVAANLTSDLTIDRLADHCGMTPRTFARAYVSQHGRTPGKMVEAMRLEAACRALEETQLPLKSVAANTGYGDEQNLRRVFQRRLSISPTHYRDRFSVHRDGAPEGVAPGR